jgi:HicB-like protein involved in pilus formation
MELSEYAASLRAELAAITRVAGEDVSRAAELLTGALEPSIRLTLLDVLSAAAAEITDRLEDTVVEVRLAGGDPSFVVQTSGPEVPAPPGPPTPPGAPAEPADDGTARVTLRLQESLKARVEAAAASEGVSVNTWLTRAIRRGLEAPVGGTPQPPRRGPGRRITGFARG